MREIIPAKRLSSAVKSRWTYGQLNDRVNSLANESVEDGPEKRG